ncbi:MAG: hypothetical protein ACLVJ1_04600 [Oscillospiraceae bacterium]
MNENIDFIVLEHDDGAGCALIAATVEGAVPAIDGYNTPYIVAEGYDHAARDWENCRLFDDIGKAKLAYEKLRGREYSLDADMPDSIAFRAKHSDIGTDDYRAKDFYKNAYRLIDDSYTAIAWRSEDRSLVYLAVADRGETSSPCCTFRRRRSKSSIRPRFPMKTFSTSSGPSRTSTWATPMRRATPWPNSPARRGRRHRSGVPCWSGLGMENSILRSSSDSPPTRTRARRGPSADFPTRSWKSEIAKAAAALDSKPRHLRSPELQHRSVMLRTEKAHRLHESRSREMEKGGPRPAGLGRRGLEGRG